MKRLKIDRVNPFTGQPTKYSAWTIQDEAIHRGYNYAEMHAKAHQDLARYKETTVHAILKNAYVEGFLHGFAHKFDDTNYEGDK